MIEKRGVIDQENTPVVAIKFVRVKAGDDKINAQLELFEQLESHPTKRVADAVREATK